mgnify:FL=1
MKDLEPKSADAEDKPAKRTPKAKGSLEDVVKKIEEQEE